MADKNEALEAAIKAGDLFFVRSYLDNHPQAATTNYSFGGGHGTPLHMAAFNNQPKIIEHLVSERGVSVNRSEGVSVNWTPLHHAAHAKAVEAAAKLLELGADTGRVADKEEYAQFVASKAVMEARDPEYLAKLHRKRIEGTWFLNSDHEIIHDYQWPNEGLRLTDAFNFETRKQRSIVRDIVSGSLSHADTFFDDMPDTTEVQKAFAKLKELGGKADESAVPGRGLGKKAPRLQKPQG